MLPRPWLARIEDILGCAKNIRDFTAGTTFSKFLEDLRTIRAVAFEFTTIGEAACVIPQEIQERYPDVPWGKMQGIRNVLVHEYFRKGFWFCEPRLLLQARTSHLSNTGNRQQIVIIARRLVIGTISFANV